MLPLTSVARAQMRAAPVRDGVQRCDQRRQAYGSRPGSSDAVVHVAPSSSLIATFAISGAPENANPRISYACPAFAFFGAVVMFDLTNSSVTGDISSGLNVTPGAPAVSE